MNDRGTAFAAALLFPCILLFVARPVRADPPGRTRWADRSLADALKDLQAQGLRIVFSSDLVRPDMKVKSEPRAVTPREILDEILAPHGLLARAGPGDTLLVTKDPGRRPASAPEELGRIEGTVHNLVDRRPLAGIRVDLVGWAASVRTLSDGKFAFERIPSGSYVVEARASGYVTRRAENVAVVPRGVAKVSFELAPLPSSHEEVVVGPSLFSFRRGEPETKQLLSREEIDRAPHIGDDPFRVVSLLPGTTPSDFSAKTNIRGGQDNELLVLLDGQQLYNPFHLKDFLSSFTILDSRAIGGLDFLTGGFPAEYGNRMSGVIDVTTNGPASRRKSTIGVSLISVYGFSEGAYAGDRGHWLFSARDGFLHYLVKIAHAEEYDPKYYDLLGRTEYALTPSSSLSANLLAASDDVRFDKTNNPEHVRSTSSDIYGWLGLRSILGPKIFVETIVSIAKIESRRTGGFQDTGVDVTVSDARHASFLGLTQAWSWEISDTQTPKFGFSAKKVSAHYDYDSVRRVFPPIIAPGLVRDLHPEPSGTDAGAYVSDILRLSPSLTADLGVRWDEATYAGAGNGDFSPRANLVWSPGAGSSVRLAWGLFIQPQGIYELQVEDGVSRFFPAQRSEHRVLSFEQSLPRGYSFRIEAYQKRIDRIRPSYESLISKLLNFPETRFDRIRVAPERAEAKGAEILVRHDSGGRFSWWGSYALSKAEDRIGGVWYPRSWDQRHAVNLDLNYRAGQKWNFNASWIYHTGWPETGLTIESVDRNGDGVNVRVGTGPYNALRLPPYHRLDLRVSRWFPLGRGRINAFLEVTNAYNRKNVCCVDNITVAFDGNGAATLIKKYNYWLQIAPSFGLQWDF